MNQDFWKGKTVLVTGHTGFKGSWLSIILKKLGSKVIGFSKDIPTNPSMYEITQVEEGMINIIGDINDFQLVKQTIEKYKPEIVIHMAAQAIVRESYKNPLETFSTNILGTANVLEAIRKSSCVKVAIMVTSDKSYKVKNSNQKYIEEDAMGGFDPYSSSKGCAELITSAYRNSFFDSTDIAVASVRAGNVLGGGDWAEDRLIPDMIRGIQQKSIMEIRNPDATRPWQFVLDPIHGYLILAEKMWNDRKKYSHGWNFGPTNDDEKPVKWIIEFLKDQMEQEIEIKIDNSEQPHETKYLNLDCSKSQNLLGWSSKMTIEQTLLFTLDWYKEFLKDGDMKRFTEKQIEKFMEE